MAPRRIAQLILGAILVGTLVPARASWVCPDGTPCAVDAARGFVCAGEQCAKAAGCCEAAGPIPCRHGGPSIAVADPGDSPSLGGAGHCRLSVAGGSAPAVQSPAAGLPAAPTPARTGEARIEPPSSPGLPAILLPRRDDSCRPPPVLDAGPARAPPAA